MKARYWMILICGLCLAVCAPAWAQTANTGRISGLILDPQGSAVAGAQVALISETGVRREVSSDEGGRYAFSLLPPDVYRVEVKVTGFQPVVVEKAIAKITETTDLDIKLQLESQKQSITVTAEAPLVQTEAATRGTVIEGSILRQLPLPTRNFQQMLTLTAGTVGSVPNSSELGRGDTVFNVNGQRSLSNAVVINGVDANSIGTGSTPNLSVPASDTLQEFIVQTSLYDASQGRNTGGIVAAVTKSGGNAHHGNVYEFLRDDSLNANNFFLNRAGVKKPKYRKNQFGGTLGGPIIKDKLWYFVSYQGTRETNGTSITNSLSTVFIPGNLTSNRLDTDADFLAFLTSFGFTPVTVNPAAKFLLQARLPNGQFAIPSAPGATSTSANTPVATPVPGLSKFREDQFNANLDFQVSTNNRLGGKFFGANNPTTQALFNSFGTGNALPLPGFGADVDFKQRLISVVDSHIFGANLLNEARFGYSRITTRAVPQEPFTSAQVGIASPLSSRFPGMPTISVSNFFDVGASPFSDNDATVQTYTYGDTLSWKFGKHTLKGGAEFKQHSVALRFDLYTRGNMFALGFSGNPFRDFLGAFFNLNGLSIMGSGVNNRDNRARDAAWFVNDDWHVSNRLTVTLGLRWDYYGPFRETSGRYVAFDPALQGTAVIPPVPPAVVSPGVAITGGFVQAGNASTALAGIPKGSDSLVESDFNNFGPRVGFAWQPFSHSNRFVIRGGYGVYYDRPNARLYNNQILNFPYYTLAQVIGAPIASPFVQVPQPSAFPLLFTNTTQFPYGGPPAVLPAAVAASACAPAGSTCVSANGLYPNVRSFRMPYVQQYNLGVQHEFAQDWLVDVSFVGSVGHKLHRLRALNQGVAAGGAGLLSPGLSSLAAQGFGVHVVESSSNSNYNSLQTTLTKRFSHGLQMLVAYTWSHSFDHYSGDASGTSDNSVVPGNQVVLNNYASSDYDRRHRLVLSYVYDFPKFYQGDLRALRYVVNDWEVAGILTAQTGTPFTLIGNANAFVQTRANISVCSYESAQFSGPVNGRLSNFFETSCFSQPSGAGNFGNTARNPFRGPAQQNMDFSVIKFIPINEQWKFEFRTEFFNVFNNVSFANPVNVRASANFGQIVRTSTGPRVIQFGFKLNF